MNKIIRKVQYPQQIPEILDEFGLNLPKPTIVLVGGAKAISKQYYKKIEMVTNAIAQAAEECGAVVLDGGTQYGVMKAMGLSRNSSGNRFPLIGVVVEKLTDISEAISTENKAKLDSHHSHFILVPGAHWGHESPWLAYAANCICLSKQSLTIVLNGGENTLQDVLCSYLSQRPVLTITGSGRLADNLAKTNLDSLNLFTTSFFDSGDVIRSKIMEFFDT